MDDDNVDQNKTLQPEDFQVEAPNSTGALSADTTFLAWNINDKTLDGTTVSDVGKISVDSQDPKVKYQETKKKAVELPSSDIELSLTTQKYSIFNVSNEKDVSKDVEINVDEDMDIELGARKEEEPETLVQDDVVDFQELIVLRSLGLFILLSHLRYLKMSFIGESLYCIILQKLVTVIYQ